MPQHIVGAIDMTLPGSSITIIVERAPEVHERSNVESVEAYEQAAGFGVDLAVGLGKREGFGMRAILN
jgi:hypothetical protein